MYKRQVWGCAVFGIVLNSISVERFKKISMVCYIASGWCVVIAIVPLVQKLAWPGVLLLVLGGVAYTAGILFYRKKSKMCIRDRSTCTAISSARQLPFRTLRHTAGRHCFPHWMVPTSQRNR